MATMSPVYLRDLLDLERLRHYLDEGLIALRLHPDGQTRLLNYTARAQYQGDWSKEIRICRGLVISTSPFEPDCAVLARPFAKFANVAEHGPDSPFGSLDFSIPFEVLEKIDGSLVIGFDAGRGIEFCTRGSFVSDQALAATRLWQEQYQDVEVPRGVTPLFEYVAPWNRIVVNYDTEDLVFLAALDIESGADVDWPTWPGRRAQRFDGLSDFSALDAHMRSHDTNDSEGFVLRFLSRDGSVSHRAKIKYDEYLRVHRLVTGVSTLTIYEHLVEHRSLDELLERVPDEFYDFVSTTIRSLTDAHDELVSAALTLAAELRGLDRKAAAAIITAQDQVPASLVFAALDRRDVSGPAWKMLRPEFAQPSSASRAEG